MRIVAMNEPVTIERALIGRELTLEQPIIVTSSFEMSSWSSTSATTSLVQNHPPSEEKKPQQSCKKIPNLEDAFHLSSAKSSHFLLTTKRDELAKNFEISISLRTLDEEGVVFVVTVSFSLFCSSDHFLFSIPSKICLSF